MYKYFFLLFLTCCTSNQPPQKISFVPKRNTVAKFYCSLENSSKISIEVNNKKVENNKKVMINYFYDFTVDTLGNRIINITFEKFFVNIKNNDDEEDYSSEKEDESSIMMDKVLKLIKGSSIQIEIDSKGKITKVLGAEDISTKVIKSLPDYQDNSNDIIKKQISEFIGQNFIKENLVNNFQLIPDSAIAIGTTWKQKTGNFNQIPINAEVENKLVSVNNGVGLLISKATITTNNLKTLSVMDLNVKSDLNGELNGEYKILENSGFVLKANSKLNLSGTITVSNQDIPITLKMTKSFKAEVVK